MKVILLLCLAVVAHAANVQRIARNTEGIIPSIVQEILKVELKSDLKKNSAVEVEVQEPVVKDVVPAEPAISRIAEEEKIVVEEKMPVVVETIVETVPSVRTVMEEKMPEVVEKVEIVAVETIPEKPVDNFRTEPVPSVEQPKVVEVVKETIIMEPTPELRNAPFVPEIVKAEEEEEIIKPMVRNVIKEEIPQIEELRVVPGMEAVKDFVPEPIASSNIVQPVVEVEPQVKTVVIETIKEEMPIKDEMTVIKTVPEMIMKTEEMPEVKAAVVPEIMIEEKMPVVEMVKDEVKSVPEEKKETETMEESMIMPGVKAIEDGRQNVIQQAVQQVQQAIQPVIQPVVNTLQNVPVVGQIVQRITPTTAEPVAPSDDDTPSTDTAVVEETADATTRAPGPLQSLVQNVQQLFSPPASNSVSDTQTETQQSGSPFQQGAQLVSNLGQNILTNLQNAGQSALNQVTQVFRPQSANTPSKTEEGGDEAPVEVAEGAKSAIPEKLEKVEKVELVEEKKEVEDEKPTETQS